MLAKFRALVKSPFFIALLVLVLASFLLGRARDIFRSVGSVGSNAVIQAGSRSVSPARFAQIFQDELKNYSQQSGQTITAQDAIHAGLDRQIADQVASDEAAAEMLIRMGVHPSDKLIVEEIRKAPVFFNPVTGQFDKNAYRRFIAQLNMTESEFEGLLRSEIAEGQFVSGIAPALRAPLIYGALAAASQGEGRSFSYFVMPPTAVPPTKTPTDAQLNAFIKENADRLKRPEMRVLTVLRFSSTDLSSTLPVSPAEVQKRFDFEKDALTTPEKRTVIEIPVHSPADAARAADALKHGQTPEAAGRSVGAEPLTYTDQPKSAVADRKIADAAFALPVGQVSGPVQGDLGLAVIKVVAATPGHTATLEEARPKIEAEVRKADAQAKIDAEVRKYEDSRSGGANLAQAAQAAGVTPTTVGPITAQGANPQGQPQPIAPKLLQAAFALPAGGDSDIIDLGNGDYAAVQVAKIVAPAVPALDEIRPLLTRYWMMHDLQLRLLAKANELADQVRKGQPIASVAASVGATPGDAVDVMRSNAGQTFSQQLLGELFLSKPGDVVVGSDIKPGGMVIAKLQGVVPASGPVAAQSAANERPVMTRSLLQELGQAVRNAARDQVKPRVDYARATAAASGGAGAAQ